MPRIDSEKFYISAIEMHGTAPQGVNWLSKETQEIRFKVLLKMLPKNIEKYSIVDAGCGFGDFYLYMERKKRLPKEYVGIDSLSDMYEIASNKTGCKIIIADICKDTLPQKDYYVCSGAMNVLKSFETHLFIRNCYESSTYGFVFNILHGDRDSETYNYLSTQEIKKIARELGVKKVMFNDDYLEDDITVMFLKDVE